MTNFTKKEIKNTFLEMLEEMPLNQITVKGLTARCGINRNSFYPYLARRLLPLRWEMNCSNSFKK